MSWLTLSNVLKMSRIRISTFLTVSLSSASEYARARNDVDGRATAANVGRASGDAENDGLAEAATRERTRGARRENMTEM